MDDKTEESKYALSVELDRVIDTKIWNGQESHSTYLTDYFQDNTSKGAYLVAEAFVNVIAQGCVDGRIPFSQVYQQVIKNRDTYEEKYLNETDNYIYSQKYLEYSRISQAVMNIDELNGTSIYNETEKCLVIKDITNLSIVEKSIILGVFAGDVTFAAFAAEVEYHADQTVALFLDDIGTYKRAIVADMLVDEEYGYETDFAHPYRLLGSEIVLEQEKAHPDYKIKH